MSVSGGLKTPIKAGFNFVGKYQAHGVPKAWGGEMI